MQWCLLSHHVPQGFSCLFSLLRNERQLPFCSEITRRCLLSALSQPPHVVFCNILPRAGKHSDIHPPASVCGRFPVNYFNVSVVLDEKLCRAPRVFSVLTGEDLLQDQSFRQMSLSSVSSKCSFSSEFTSVFNRRRDHTSSDRRAATSIYYLLTYNIYNFHYKFLEVTSSDGLFV